MASVIIFRIITAYEVAGMRSACEHGENRDGEVIEMRTVPTPTEMEISPSELERGECKVHVELSELIFAQNTGLQGKEVSRVMRRNDLQHFCNFLLGDDV